MDLFKISGFASLIVNGSLGLFVLSRNPKRALNIRFAAFSLCIALWSVGSAYVNVILDENAALWALRSSYLFGVWVPSLFFLFVATFIGWEQRFKLLLRISYCVSAILMFFALTEYLIPAFRLLPAFGYRIDVPGPIYIAFAIFFNIAVSGTLLLLVYFYFKEANQKQRKQLQFIFVGYFFGAIAGLEYFLGVFNVLKRPPFDDYVLIITFASMAYGITRHQLLDIEVIIKKTVVFTGIFAMAMSVVSLVSTIMQTYASQFWIGNPKISTLISVVLALFLYQPTRILLVRITDRFLFQRKTEIKTVLTRLSKEIVTIVDVEQIGKTVLETLKDTLRIESGMVFLENKKFGNYRMLDHFGMTSDELVSSLRYLLEDPAIVRYFADYSLSVINLDYGKVDVPVYIANWFKVSKARVCILLNISEEQFGFLILGKKKSDQEFTQEENDIFPTIASQAALAIRNARLVENVLEEREAKVKAEHLAERVKFARMIKHETKNKLAHIDGPAHEISAYFIPKLKKVFKENDEEWFQEVCGNVVSSSQKISDGVRKVLDIVETALGGLDKDDQTMRRMSCKIIWDDAKEESGLIDQIEFESQMPDGFAVYVNYYALQRVFVNLITNAYDAAMTKDNVLIKLRCSYETVDNAPVAYFEFQDFGPGIPPEIKEKIFQDGFSTKPKPSSTDLISSGHGQGLSACKMYVEKIHKGKLWIESEQGNGATFKFWIPMKEDG